MRISEVTQPAHYDPNALYLHGGPQQLEGARLKRYGKLGSDSGGLFFCKDTPVGRWYASAYGERIWICRLKPTIEQIFDLTNPRHLAGLRQHTSPQEFSYVMAAARAGHLDWAVLDEEMLEELGFRGAVMLERPKGAPTGFPPESNFATLPENVLSVVIFRAEDVEIVGSSTRAELLR